MKAWRVVQVGVPPIERDARAASRRWQKLGKVIVGVIARHVAESRRPESDLARHVIDADDNGADDQPRSWWHVADRTTDVYSAARPEISAAVAACPSHTVRQTLSVIDEISAEQLRTDLPELASGDTVRVSARVREGNRERIQVFEGTVMRLRGGGIARSITVRSIRSGVGVERTFKVHSPRIEKIEVVRHGVARRAQLYFLRQRVGKAASLRERRPS